MDMNNHSMKRSKPFSHIWEIFFELTLLFIVSFFAKNWLLSNIWSLLSITFIRRIQFAHERGVVSLIVPPGWLLGLLSLWRQSSGFGGKFNLWIKVFPATIASDINPFSSSILGFFPVDLLCHGAATVASVARERPVVSVQEWLGTNWIAFPP